MVKGLILTVPFTNNFHNVQQVQFDVLIKIKSGDKYTVFCYLSFRDVMPYVMNLTRPFSKLCSYVAILLQVTLPLQQPRLLNQHRDILSSLTERLGSL